MLSVYLKCVSRFFQSIRISNKEFVSDFTLQMENNIIWALWIVWERKFVEKRQICGMKIHGFRTTITHHLTRLSFWTNSWPETQRISSNKRRIHLMWLRPTFFLFPKRNGLMIGLLTECVQGEAHKVLQSDRTQTIYHIQKCFRQNFQCSRRPSYSTTPFFIGGGAETTSRSTPLF